MDEKNPFKRPSRWRRWIKRPKRETAIRAAIAVVAGTVGWGIGARPWTAPQKGRTETATSAPAPKKAPGAARPIAAPKTVLAADRRLVPVTHAAAAPAKPAVAAPRAATAGKTQSGSSTKARTKAATPSQTKASKPQPKSKAAPAKTSGKTG